LRLIDLEFDEANTQKLWTEDSPSHREFRYAHPQSSLQFVIKVSRLGTKTVIMGIAIGDDKTTSFDFKTDDFTSAAFFPWTAENGNVTGGFIGENRMKDLAGLFKINVLQRLIPGLSKVGYIEEANTNTENPPQGLVAPPTLAC
jgi:proteasome inhibitor subunit 1 (PI31)